LNFFKNAFNKDKGCSATIEKGQTLNLACTFKGDFREITFNLQLKQVTQKNKQVEEKFTTLVYHNSATGEALNNTNIKNLISAIKNGKHIRVVTNDFAADAYNITLSYSTEVTAIVEGSQGTDPMFAVPIQSSTSGTSTSGTSTSGTSTPSNTSYSPATPISTTTTFGGVRVAPQSLPFTTPFQQPAPFFSPPTALNPFGKFESLNNEKLLFTPTKVTFCSNGQRTIYMKQSKEEMQKGQMFGMSSRPPDVNTGSNYYREYSKNNIEIQWFAWG